MGGLIMQYNNTYPVHLADIKTVVQAASTPLDAAFAVTDFLNVTKSAEGGCVDLGASAFYRSLMNATLPLSGQGNAMRTWTWQTCNEFGYFQTAQAAALCGSRCATMCSASPMRTWVRGFRKRTT